jgi:hypothetical protein
LVAEIKTKDGIWYVRIDDNKPVEFKSRFHAVIFISNKTLTLVDGE